MNLTDVITGGLVFSLASAGSLQIYAASLGWTGGHRGRQEQAVDLELGLVQVSRQLQQLMTGEPSPGGDCVRAAADLVSVLEAMPLAQGIQRTVRQEQELVRVTLQARGLQQRQRWFSPAAHGLCGSQA